MKEEYRIFYFALLRRCVPWLLTVYSVLLLQDFAIHLFLHYNVVNYFSLNSAMRLVLLGSWNIIFSIYNICQAQKLGGIPSALSTLQERLKLFNFSFVFCTFAAFLLHPILKPLGNNNSWYSYVLPIISCLITTLMAEKSQPDNFLLSNIKPSLLSQVTKTFLTTWKSMIPMIVTYLGIFVGLKLFMWLWENLIQRNLLIHLVIPQFLSATCLLVSDHIITRRAIIESLVLMMIVQVGFSVCRDIAIYILSLPLDYGKLAATSGIDSVPRELLLTTAIENHTLADKNSLYESVVASLQDCYDDYAVKEGSVRNGKLGLQFQSQPSASLLAANQIQSKSMLQKDLVTTIPLSEHICHYYQRQLLTAYETMTHSAINHFYFPVTSSLHPWKNETIEDLLHHSFSYFTSFQFSLFYLFRCYGWNDLKQVAYDEDQQDRRAHIYEQDWNQIMDQGLQILTETILQMNIICDYVEGANPLHLTGSIKSSIPNNIRKTEAQAEGKEQQEKPKDNFLQQISAFKQRIDGTAAMKNSHESIEIERWQKKDSWIYTLLSHVIPKTVRSKISKSSIGKRINTWWENIRPLELFRDHLLPIFNRHVFMFPNPLEFANNQILPNHSITYFQQYFSPLFCQMLGNMIRSITGLYHQALQEDLKGMTLPTLPTFFLLLLQLDLSLQGYLEYCQPQFLLTVSNSSGGNNSNTSEPSQRYANTQRRYKQRAAKQLPSHLMQLSTTIREMIGVLLSDYSDLLSVTKSSVASSQRNHIINQNLYSKEMIERIRWFEEQVVSK